MGLSFFFLDREEEGDKCMEDGMGGGVFVFAFFFSRDRRFVSSDFLLASLTNSLLFFFANALYPKTHFFFCVVQPPIYRQNKFVFFNCLVSKQS
jgi:hypothetical protein